MILLGTKHGTLGALRFGMTDDKAYYFNPNTGESGELTPVTAEDLALWLNNYDGDGTDPEHDSDGEESEAEFELMDIG